MPAFPHYKVNWFNVMRCSLSGQALAFVWQKPQCLTFDYVLSRSGRWQSCQQCRPACCIIMMHEAIWHASMLQHECCLSSMTMSSVMSACCSMMPKFKYCGNCRSCTVSSRRSTKCQQQCLRSDTGLLQQRNWALIRFVIHLHVSSILSVAAY